MKNLIFIPYQDIFDFNNSKILTREYAILYFLLNSGYDKLICVNKPRTKLDEKEMNKISFVQGSIENNVYYHIENSKIIQYKSIINLGILLKKRGWWIDGYKRLCMQFDDILRSGEIIVYSNNPFASELLLYLKKKGANIIFDMMDNFSIHPSLKSREREFAFKGYKEISKIANFFSCNSDVTKKFCEENFDISPVLMKNGVFKLQNIKKEEIKQQAILNTEKEKFKYIAGYIGKLGKRVDENLVKVILQNCKDVLFVFVGPMLKDQNNSELVESIEKSNNAILLDAIPSTYVYDMLEKFDVLMIPHAIGERENGGDPLKLYQYLNTKKPIITTAIYGVNEFDEIITIEDNYEKWVEYFNEEKFKKINYETPNTIYWEYRVNDLLKYLENNEYS
jgi:hypothetical protein